MKSKIACYYSDKMIKWQCVPRIEGGPAQGGWFSGSILRDGQAGQVRSAW